MSTVVKIKKLMWAAVICLTASSATTLFVAFTGGDADSRVPSIILGISFWFFLISGYGLLALANRARRVYIKRHFGKDVKVQGRIGILSFFSNVPGTVADIVFAVSTVAVVVLQFTSLRSNYIMAVLMFLMVLSLNLHGVFNGRIYSVTNYKK